MRIALLYELKPDLVHEGAPDDLYSEFETLETIQAIALGLEELGHTVHLVDSQADPWEELVQLRPDLDLVFNTSVGIGSRFRELMPAALCEALRIPYTGGDPMAQALSANKHVAKLIAQCEGINTPSWFVIKDEDGLEDARGIERNVLLKPVFEGSSIGISGPFHPAREYEVFRGAALHYLTSYGQPMMVEDFIGGHEVTVCLLGNPPRSLPPMGLSLGGSFDLEDRVFDVRAKADSAAGSWQRSPPVPESVLATVQDWARRIHGALGCRDLSRSDFRVSKSLQPFFLEINATPQIAPSGSSFSAAAAAVGLDFKGLLEAITSNAIARYQSGSW